MPSNAELERRVIAVERKLDEILTELKSRPLPQRVAAPDPSYPHPHLAPWVSTSACSCPPNSVCMNVACPRAPKVTSSGYLVEHQPRYDGGVPNPNAVEGNLYGPGMLQVDL